MLRVDNWLDVAPLENMEGDHNLPFVLEIFHLKLCSRDLSFEALTLEIFPLKFSKFLMKICSLETFPMKIYSLEIFPWKIEIFFFFWKSYLEDLSFKHLKFFFKKIYSWRFFLEDSFWKFFHCNFENFNGKISRVKASKDKSLEHNFKWKISKTNGKLRSPSIFSSGRNSKLATQHSSKHARCPKLGALAWYVQLFSLNSSGINWKYLFCRN